jgi:hypothetical protein
MEGMGDSSGSRESSAAADDEKLAVLGATTRKLDGRHFPGRPPPKNSTGPRKGDKDSASAGSSGSGSTYHPPSRQSDIPVSWPSQPSSAPYTATEFNAVQSPPATALPTTGQFSSITIPANNVQLQSYENLDPALAEVLAQISGTQARENSAIFPILEKNYGSFTSALAGHAPSTVSSAQPASASSMMANMQAGHGQAQSSHMQFDMTGVQKPGYQPTYGFAKESYDNYASTAAPSKPRGIGKAEDLVYESEEDMSSSPGRQYFEGHPEEASIQPVLQDALSPPPPGPVGLPPPIPPSSQQQRQYQQQQYQDPRSRHPMGPPPARHPPSYIPSAAHMGQYPYQQQPQEHQQQQYESQQHNAPRYAGGPSGDAFQEHNWMGYYPSVMSGAAGSSIGNNTNYNNSNGPYEPPRPAAAYTGLGSARGYPSAGSSAPTHPYYTTPSTSHASHPQHHASSSGLAPLSAPATSSAGYGNAGSASLPDNVYEPSGYRVYDDLLTSLSGFPNDSGIGRR